MDNSEIQKIKDEQKKIVKNCSDLELINLYNKEVWIPSWNWTRMSFLSYIHNEFKNRWFDYSIIWNEKGLKLNKKIKLVNIEWKKILKQNTILDNFNFDWKDINNSIKEICLIWNKSNISKTKLIAWENPNWKNYISLFFWTWTHLDSNSFINNIPDDIRRQYTWKMRGMWRWAWWEPIYNFSNNEKKIVLINNKNMNKNYIDDTKFYLKELLNSELNSIEAYWKEVSIILLNFKRIVDWDELFAKEYFNTIIETLENFFMKERNIEKVYLS